MWVAERSAWCFIPPSWQPLFDATFSFPRERGKPNRHPGGRDDLLRIELDDELLGERHVDLSALRQLVHKDALAFADDLQPTRDRALPRRLTRDLERQRVDRLVLHVDDVVL